MFLETTTEFRISQDLHNSVHVKLHTCDQWKGMVEKDFTYTSSSSTKHRRFTFGNTDASSCFPFDFLLQVEPYKQRAEDSSLFIV